jgi:hypothetical protein
MRTGTMSPCPRFPYRNRISTAKKADTHPNQISLSFFVNIDKAEGKSSFEVLVFDRQVQSAWLQGA